jgi:hypothetical protein
MGGEGEMAWSLCRLGSGRTRRGAREDARAVRADAFWAKSETEMGAHGLFGSPRWAVCSVRANTFGREMVVCVSPLKMPS